MTNRQTDQSTNRKKQLVSSSINRLINLSVNQKMSECQ